MTYKYYGQWDPQVDEVLHENYFKDVPTGFFVDCGASNGVLHSCTKFFEEQGWDGVCLDPSPTVFSELVLNRNVRSLNIGLADRNGTLTFTEAVHPIGSIAELPAGGSMQYPADLRNFVGAFGYKFTDIVVDVLTYDSLIENLGIDKVDFMIIDVEGFELSIIKGMSKCLPGVLCVEHPFIGVDILKQVLGDLGYRFDFVSFNNAFFSMGYPLKDWFGVTHA